MYPADFMWQKEHEISSERRQYKRNKSEEIKRNKNHKKAKKVLARKKNACYYKYMRWACIKKHAKKKRKKLYKNVEEKQ